MSGSLRITEVRCFCTQPGGSRLTVVRVRTSESGLYGLGCATFTQRATAVKTVVETYIAPLVIGRDPRNIEDIWHTCMVSGYWRNGPVLNNAVSGIDMALWDIKGKLAGMPCYELWGGKARPDVPVYGHADGQTPEEVLEHTQALIDEGYKYIRCQIGGYPGLERKAAGPRDADFQGAYFNPRERLWAVPRLFEYLRNHLEEQVELLHDVHERLAPIDAMWLAKRLEPYRLFFLEDLLAPEDLEWFERVRNLCATPLAMGELWNNPVEILPLVSRRLIDFVRAHVSQIGGVTSALKLAHMCEAFGIRTAWHGPGDVSPVGMNANLHLDVAIHNFGVQEWARRSDAEYEIFPGLPEVRQGCVSPSEQPGWGIDFDEMAAARFPCDTQNPAWTRARLPDGTSARP